MKVKEVIESLQKVNQELPVYICDEIEGNDCELIKIEKSTTHNMKTFKCDKNVIMLHCGKGDL